jgi:transposase
MKNNKKANKIQLNKEEKVALLEQEVVLLKAKVSWYEEQLKINNQKRFGISSEKTNPDQLSFFNEAELDSNIKEKEPEIEEITYKRKKKDKKTFEENYGNLAVERIEYDISEEEKICPECNNELHQMAIEITRTIKIILAEAVIVENVKKIYSCRHCEANNISTPIIKAKAPNPVIKGSHASPSIIAYAMDKKYTSAMPLYRQEKEFSNFGINISRQTLSNWIIRSSNDWLTPIYNRLHEYLVKEKYLHANETTLQVLKEDGRKATNKSYMWLYTTTKYGKPIVLYDYRTTRANKHPKKFLEEFKGYLQTDAYAGYNNIPDVTIAGCFAHARRYFKESLTAVPDETSLTHLSATKGLGFCNALFKVERKIKDLSPEDRYGKRLEESKPIIDEFSDWLKITKRQALPKSSFGKAIGYTLNQWTKLKMFLEDGHIEIDNNRAERAIRPFVIGRKNFLFSNTPKGATASATIYSIVETAKANNLNPYYYLKHLFEQMPNIDISDQEEIDKLLPWSESIPNKCKIPNANK